MTPLNQSQYAAAPAQEPQRAVLLWVPFEHKDQAKALGAKWDRQAHAWYVPAGIDAAPFAQWTQRQAEAPAHESQRQSGREYLDVPYGERKAAKAAGAAWDPMARCWFVGPHCDRQKLARWQPGKADPDEFPTARDAFAAALRAMGCVVSGEHPVMDGQRHGIAVEGTVHTGAAAGAAVHTGTVPDDADEAAFYVAHLEGRPHGYIRNFRTGIDMQWKAKAVATPGKPQPAAAL
ncbi:DUF5710 domain-containing protein [Pantoea sp. 18069]|uniref:DUF5710 domain-containing protein n=1 Tax=Pantoea sp. 18069 TaxID=2681415 RepID=UPI00135B5843|nr:DUF5710 domain-containing protein [Pantoea sp. 18069]